MKDYFTYHEGKILAHDDKKGIQEYKYQDNIENILLLENEIEKITDKIDDIYKDIAFNQEILDANESPIKSISGKIGTSLIVSLILGTIISFNILPIYSNFSLLNSLIVYSSFFGLSLSMIFGIEILVEKSMKKYKDKIKDDNIEIKSLMSTLNKKQEHLLELKKESKKDNENKLTNEDYKTKLVFIKNITDFYKTIEQQKRDYIFEKSFPKLSITEETREDVLKHPNLYSNCDVRTRMGKFYTDEEYEKHIEESLNRPLPGEENTHKLIKRIIPKKK